jgi:hypothetical protein
LKSDGWCAVFSEVFSGYSTDVESSLFSFFQINLSWFWQVLYLWKNKLVGTIPQTLGQNTNLTLLNLSSNFLNGMIPQDLCIGQKLQWLILQYNQLTGPIPESLGNCQSLTKLCLSYSFLNRLIPTGLLGLLNISMEEVKANNIIGPIPSTFISAPLLGYFDFSDNYLSSSLPASIGNLTRLQQFLLSGNRFSGLIPPQICDMPLLNKLDLSLNNLLGPIPSQYPTARNLGPLIWARTISWARFHQQYPTIRNLGPLIWARTICRVRILSKSSTYPISTSIFLTTILQVTSHHNCSWFKLWASLTEGEWEEWHLQFWGGVNGAFDWKPTNWAWYWGWSGYSAMG